MSAASSRAEGAPATRAGMGSGGAAPSGGVTGSTAQDPGPEITPAATDEEVAAILAAHEALWPKPVAFAADAAPAEVSRWRFSGRWWSKPVVRRDRPGG